LTQCGFHKSNDLFENEMFRIYIYTISHFIEISIWDQCGGVDQLLNKFSYKIIFFFLKSIVGAVARASLNAAPPLKVKLLQFHPFSKSTTNIIFQIHLNRSCVVVWILLLMLDRIPSLLKSWNKAHICCTDIARLNFFFF
jgi:hypothetical protein